MASDVDDGFVSDERYESAWRAHVDDLDRLGWHLNEDQMVVLEECQEQLHRLVDEAARRRRER